MLCQLAGAGTSARRSVTEVGPDAAGSYARRSLAEVEPGATWLAVVICAGWNCREQQVLAENFVAAELCHATNWQEFARCMNGHSSVRRPFAEVAESLGRPTMQLWQTKQGRPSAGKSEPERICSRLQPSVRARCNLWRWGQGGGRQFVIEALHELQQDVASCGPLAVH